MDIIQDYQKYRWFFTSSNKLVVAGKNAEQNDFLLKQAIKIKNPLLVMHTSEPGSPFSLILSPIEKLSEKDKISTAIFTACFSQVWKKGKSQIQVDSFLSTQLEKTKSLKTGTWQLKQKLNSYKIFNPELVLIKQKNILRAVPKEALKPNQKPLLKIIQGKKDKQAIFQELKQILSNVSAEEILSALPSGGLAIK